RYLFFHCDWFALILPKVDIYVQLWTTDFCHPVRFRFCCRNGFHLFKRQKTPQKKLSRRKMGVALFCVFCNFSFSD
ncbi:MAG: hypothetical protein AAGD88_18030, partial [Bacteroidota bacterium]